MRQNDDVLESVEVRVNFGRSGLGAEDVESCSVDLIVLERLDECRLVDLSKREKRGISSARLAETRPSSPIHP